MGDVHALVASYILLVHSVTLICQVAGPHALELLAEDRG